MCAHHNIYVQYCQWPCVNICMQYCQWPRVHIILGADIARHLYTATFTRPVNTETHTSKVGQNHVCTMYIYGIFGKETTKFAVIYGAFTQIWPTLHTQTHTHTHTHTRIISGEDAGFSVPDCPLQVPLQILSQCEVPLHILTRHLHTPEQTPSAAAPQRSLHYTRKPTPHTHIASMYSSNSVLSCCTWLWFVLGSSRATMLSKFSCTLLGVLCGRECVTSVRNNCVGCVIPRFQSVRAGIVTWRRAAVDAWQGARMHGRASRKRVQTSIKTLN